MEFLGETWRGIEQESLMAVSTEKSLGKPAGSFQIIIKVSNRISRSANSTSAEDPAKTLEDVAGGVNFWLDTLRPMMLVRIKMQPMLRAQDPPPSNLDPATLTLLTNLTMLGCIDTVGIQKSMSPEGPVRTVVVTGRDLGKLFTDDAHYTFAWAALITDASNPAKSGVIIPTDATATTKQIQDFITRYYVRDASSLQTELIAETVGQAINVLYKKASALDVVLSDTSKLQNYLPYPLIAENVAPIPFFGGSGFFQMTGSVWAMFEYVVPKPWGEVFVDTVGDQARLIVRRPPWGRAWEGQQEMLDQVLARVQKVADTSQDAMKTALANSSATPIHSTTGASLTNLTGATRYTTIEPGDTEAGQLNDLLEVTNKGMGQITALTAMGGALWHYDEFQDLAGRTRVTNEPYHVVTDKEVINMTLSKGDREALNLFFPFPGSMFMHGDEDPMMAAQLVPPVLDIDSVLRYGLRLFQAENRWWMPKDQPVTDGSGGIDFLSQLLLDTIRVYLYFRHNAEYLSGTIHIMGRDEIRIGDHLVLNEFNESNPTLFYVEGVSNSWQFGSEFVTSLTVTRGQPLYLPQTGSGRFVPLNTPTPL